MRLADNYRCSPARARASWPYGVVPIHSSPRARHVVIAGGGFAALEAALALRALARQQVRVSLLPPNAAFAYRPSATVDALAGSHLPPSLSTWSLPVYELAFLSAAHAARHGASTEIAVVSPERAPLELFGPHASRLVAGLMADRGIRFIGGTTPHSVRRDGFARDAIRRSA